MARRCETIENPVQRDRIYLVNPPIPLQKALFTAPAPIAKMLGYKARYPKYSGPV